MSNKRSIFIGVILVVVFHAVFVPLLAQETKQVGLIPYKPTSKLFPKENKKKHAKVAFFTRIGKSQFGKGDKIVISAKLENNGSDKIVFLRTANDESIKIDVEDEFENAIPFSEEYSKQMERSWAGNSIVMDLFKDEERFFEFDITDMFRLTEGEFTITVRCLYQIDFGKFLEVKAKPLLIKIKN